MIVGAQNKKPNNLEYAFRTGFAALNKQKADNSTQSNQSAVS